MPAFIRTKEDEARWSKAKEAANKQRSEADGDVYWGLVNHIYQNMKKTEMEKSQVEAAIERINAIRGLLKTEAELFLSKPELLDKAADALQKARGDSDEEDQGYDLQDHEGDEEDDSQLSPEDMEGMSVVDDPYDEGGDEAGKWLDENDPAGASAEGESEGQEEKVSPKRSSSYTEWKPHGQYSQEQKSAMEEYQKQGYSPREAERMAGAHRDPRDFQSALNHTVRPSQPSPKFLEEMKQLAGHWLDRADRHSKLSADPEKNPQKFASGKMMQAHEEKTKDYGKAYNDFLNSDKVKGLKGLERHKAVQAFKQQWKEQNPDYHENLVAGVSGAQKHYGEAQEARAKNLDERMRHIMTGGQQEGAMGMQEAAQHVGGTKGEGGEGYSSTVIKDPSASFAQANPKLVEMLRNKLQPEQFDRFNRVQSARAAQGVGQKPKTIIRRPSGGSSGQGVS